MKLPRLSDRTEKLLIAIAVLTSAWIAFECLLAPQCQQLAAAGREDRARQLYLEKIEQLQNLVELRQKKLEELNHRKAFLAERFFRPDKTSKYFSSLYETADRYGCRIVSMDYQTLSEKPASVQADWANNPPIYYRAVHLDIAGPFEGWMRFLDQVESDSRWIAIPEFQIESIESRRGYLRGDIRIVLPVFCDGIPEFQYIAEQDKYEETEDHEE